MLFQRTHLAWLSERREGRNYSCFRSSTVPVNFALARPAMVSSEPLVEAPPQLPYLQPPDTSSRVRHFPVWPFAILAVPILLRAAIFAIALLTESWSANPKRIIPAW